MKRTPFKFAGQAVKIKPDVKRIGGDEFVIEDYWENVSGRSWKTSNGNPAAMEYGIRAGLSNLPIDDEVVYGKIGAMGFLCHVSELELPEEGENNA